MRMQRPPHVHLLPPLTPAAHHLQVARQRPPLLVAHLPRPPVADPRVRAAPARVHPQDVLEAEVLAQRRVHHLDGHGDEAPALGADVGAGAARAHLVVVRQIDVEDQLLGQGPEGASGPERLAVPGVRAVYRADLEARGVEFADVFAEPSAHGEFMYSREMEHDRTVRG